MNNHYKFLDSSRGLCALSVVLSHYMLGYVSPYPFYQKLSGSVLHIFWHGDSAVCYFFVLSGFVLSISFLNGQKNIQNLNIKGFLIQRFFRIYPLFILCLLISFFLQKFLLSQNPLIIKVPLQSDWIKGLWNHKKSAYDLIKEAVLVISMPGESYLRLLPQDWSLNRELWFSFLIPILVLLLKKGKTWFLLLFFILYFSSYNSAILCFFSGILIAKFHPQIRTATDSWHIIFKILFLLIGCVFYTAPFGFLSVFCGDHAIRISILQSVGASLLLVSFLSFKKLQSLLSNTILVSLGRISYGIYLVHFFILLGILPFVALYINNRNLISNEIILILILFSVLIVLTILLAHIFYNPIEKRFNIIGKELSKKYYP